jgi:hypothetical protein
MAIACTVPEQKTIELWKTHKIAALNVRYKAHFRPAKPARARN